MHKKTFALGLLLILACVLLFHFANDWGKILCIAGIVTGFACTLRGAAGYGEPPRPQEALRDYRSPGDGL